jgi:excisionase family DNA binding protein
MRRCYEMTREYLSVDDVCKELDIGKTKAYQLIKDKKIKSCKVGKKIIIRKKDLDSYINKLVEE